MKSAAKLSGLGWSGGIATEPGRMVKGAGQILDEVAFRFQPDREPDQRIEDAGLCASLRAHAEMGHGGGVGCQAFDAAKGFGQGEQAKRLDETTHFSFSALQFETEHGTETALLPACRRRSEEHTSELQSLMRIS